ncbi:Cationic amino acid transporter-1 [Apophysomyces ossiformis]|uniref:Cationic amino acid transporter-1 n=1 Tax=Apophysomyces ossiformis TaxID=679940 RepID=A0A8H7BJ77_9FUNG|nr:Cationic amino acid transporter-1 [Apophysomyces ossiformis]
MITEDQSNLHGQYPLTENNSGQYEPQRRHSWFRQLGTRKTMESIERDADEAPLHRALSTFQLIFVGIGAIIGTGIFVLSGQAAARNAGPAVTISFIIAALAAALAALSYSEMASMIPVSGSAYTYAYATMGEFMAWIIGWDLILEYMVGSATVAVGWSGYFSKFFALVANAHFGESWTTPPLVWEEGPPATLTYVQGRYFNVPGFMVVMIVTLILTMGPYLYCQWSYEHTVSSYIGFDAVTTVALEARNPKRDLPIGILGSLLISTALYIATCTIMTGAVKYTELMVSTPVTVAVDAVQQRTGKDFRWLNVLVAIGALCGLTSVLLVGILAMSRVLYSMAQDGLLPSGFAIVHPRLKTPYVSTLTVGIITAVLAAVLPVDLLGNMTSIGTLLAFFVVHGAVIIMRIKRPHAERRFKIPGGKYVSLIFPALGMIISITLIAVAEVTTIWRLFVWMAIGWIFYFLYGLRHSKLARDRTGHQNACTNENRASSNGETCKPKEDQEPDEERKPVRDGESHSMP